MAFGYWSAHVPVEVRRRKAAREAVALKKSGRDVAPVVIERKTIARTFWGKAWCTNLESYSDYATRLPRGRTYVRNGSVIHLAIEHGTIEALVCGSRRSRTRSPCFNGAGDEDRRRDSAVLDTNGLPRDLLQRSRR